MINIIFGSNRIINTNGILTFIDKNRRIKKELFKVEMRSDLQQMITLEIRDENDQLLGKVYRSVSFVYVYPDYEGLVDTEDGDVKRLGLKRKEDNALIFEIIKKSASEVEINGVFHIRGCMHAFS